MLEVGGDLSRRRRGQGCNGETETETDYCKLDSYCTVSLLQCTILTFLRSSSAPHLMFHVFVFVYMSRIGYDTRYTLCVWL